MSGRISEIYRQALYSIGVLASQVLRHHLDVWGLVWIEMHAY